MNEAQLTFKLAAQQDVYPAKDMHRLGDSSAALAHSPAIAANSAYAVLPAFTVLAIALALVDELAELGAALVILDLLRWQTAHHVVAVRQQLPDQADA